MKLAEVTRALGRMMQGVLRGSWRRDRATGRQRVLPEELHSLFDDDLAAHSASLDRMLRDRETDGRP